MTEQEQQETTLAFLKGLGYSVEQALWWVYLYRHRYAGRMSWADYRRQFNRHAADSNGPCQDHKPEWPDLTPAEILAATSWPTPEQADERVAGILARGGTP